MKSPSKRVHVSYVREAEDMCHCTVCKCSNHATDLGNGLCMPCAWGKHNYKKMKYKNVVYK